MYYCYKSQRFHVVSYPTTTFILCKFHESAVFRVQNDQDDLFNKIKESKERSEELSERAAMARGEVYEDEWKYDDEGDTDDEATTDLAKTLHEIQLDVQALQESTQRDMAGVDPNSRQYHERIVQDIISHNIHNMLTAQAINEEHYESSFDTLGMEEELRTFQEESFDLRHELSKSDLPPVQLPGPEPESRTSSTGELSDRSSNLDDFADPSDEMPDYTGGDD